MPKEDEEILTNDDILFLKGSPEFGRLIQHLQAEVAGARLEADDISQAGLLALQGRIATLKNIILLFEGFYYE